MAVLIEAISVVIKRSAIEAKYPGGWESFVADVPNQTLGADDELARVGFMIPNDVESYVKHLEQYALIYIQDGSTVDLAVVDQQRGFAIPCDWAGFGHGALDGDKNRKVAGCQAFDSKGGPLITPDGWKYEGSLSQTFAFAPTEHVDKSLKFLRHENGLDVYFNSLTGKDVYIGRTGTK